MNNITVMVRMIRMPEVENRSGFGRSSIYNKVNAGLFPEPVQIGPNSVAWIDYEVDALNRARIAGKTDEEIRQLVKELKASRGTINDSEALAAHSRSARAKKMVEAKRSRLAAGEA